MVPKDEIIQRIQSADLSRTNIFLEGHFQPEEIRSSAVVIPLVERENGWNLVFIRRTNHKNDQHSGQVAFPGGKQEASDQTLLDTALREFQEEIGVDPEELEVFGKLQDMITVTKFQVSPYTAFLNSSYVPDPDPSEVDRLFEIPLNWLIEPLNRNQYHRIVEGQNLDVIIFQPYDGETLWGASARMVCDFIDLLQP